MIEYLLDGLIGACIGAIVVAGVAYFSFRFTRGQVKNASHDQATEFMLRLDRVFVEHPELRGVISDEAALPPEESGTEWQRVRAGIELVADTWEGILDRLGRGLYAPLDEASWRNYVRRVYRDSRRVRAFVDGNPSWYPNLSELDDENEGADLRVHSEPPAAEEPVGRHIIGDLCTEMPLSPRGARELARQVARAAEAHIAKLAVVRFPKGGLSAFAVLTDSHLAIHTWPERRYVAFDLFSCARDVDATAVVEVFATVLRPTQVHVREFQRGPDTPPPFTERAPGIPGERLYPGARVLARERSSHQTILAAQVPGLGRVLALDDVIQVADIDAYVYHELMVHPALCAHRDPAVVTIVGGGDGHALVEVLKHHAVREVHLLEHDAEVIRVANDTFEGVRAAFSDPRVTVTTCDAMEHLEKTDVVSDVLICDMTDPVDQAKRFFEAGFYKLAQRRLAPDGILVAQTGPLHWQGELVKGCLLEAGRLFRHVRLITGAMATYPGAWWSFVIASKLNDPSHAARHPKISSRLYRPQDHAWYFMPASVVRLLLGPPE